MRLYSWGNFEGVGEPMVEPTWLAWDPASQLLALAYPSTIQLCRTQPALAAFLSLPIEVCNALPWLSVWQIFWQIFIVQSGSVLGECHGSRVVSWDQHDLCAWSPIVCCLHFIRRILFGWQVL